MADQQRAGVFDKGAEKLQQGIDFIQETVQGMYWDSQMQRLGLNPADPKIVQELQRRLSESSSMPLEEYVTKPGNNTLSAATRKAAQEQALKNALMYYGKKYSATPGDTQGQQPPPGFDFFKR